MLLASLAVVLLNGTRIGLIGLYPEYYDLIHGEIGSTIVGWLTLLVITGICYRGVQSGEAKAPSFWRITARGVSGAQDASRAPG
jgi:hypothetical protein